MAALLLPLPLSAAACQPGSGQESLAKAPSGLDQKILTIRTAAGKVHRFTVEVARTEEEQQQGLMNRQSLAPDRGMIFPYDQPQQVSYWMKNTFIPLDMLFVRADGTIARIETAVPLNLEPVPSLEPVNLVVELPGGRTGELGIKPGDRVSW